MAIQLSARNQLKAKVKSVKLGTVMAEVVVELSDGQQIVSAITRTSAEGLGLKALRNSHRNRDENRSWLVGGLFRIAKSQSENKIR